jgi:hypothetical protein
MTRTIRLAAVALALSLPLQALAANFVDVPPSHWAANAVQNATNRGLIAGMPDSTFRGQQALTRLQFAQVMKQMVAEFESALKIDLKSPTYGYLAITDMAKHSAQLPLLLEMVNVYGIFPGLEDEAFRPDQPVTRYDVARAFAALIRRAEAKGIVRPAKAAPSTFRDVAPAEQDAVATVTQQYPLMQGFPGGTFQGPKALTRYEFVALAVKALPTLQAQLVPKASPTPVAKPTVAPTPKPTPLPTPTPVPTPATFGLNEELSAVYGLVPNGTIPGVSTNTQNFIGGQLQLGQPIGDLIIRERLRGMVDPSMARGASILGSFGLDLAYRFRPSDYFHIVPSIGADLWGGANNASLSQAGIAAAAGGGLSFDWWWHPAFCFSLGGEARYGIPGTGMALLGTAVPQVGLIYGGDVKFRWYPARQFAIQFGASAMAMPQFFGGSGMDLLAGPNLGIAWQF